MPSGWIKQAYVYDFDCKTITLQAENMFERMKTAENIYESVVEPLNKKLLEQIPTMLVTSSK